MLTDGTTLHCKVARGAEVSNSANNITKTAKVVRVVSEPNFNKYLNSDEASDAAGSVDFALLLLDKELDGRPLSLASAPPHEGDVLTVAGYGRNNSETIDGRLRSAQVKVEKITLTTYPGRAVIRSLRGTGNTCSGDSGGPLIQQGRLAGVLHGGRGTCAEGPNSIHASVAHHTVWINTSLQKLLSEKEDGSNVEKTDYESGTYSPPVATLPPPKISFPSISVPNVVPSVPSSTVADPTLSAVAPLNACIRFGIADYYPQLIRDGAGAPFFTCFYYQGYAAVIGCTDQYNANSCYMTNSVILNGYMVPRQ